MKDSWICRDYRSGDEHRILTLYSEVNNREMDSAYWWWRFAESPLGKGIIKLMFDGDKLIGHYAVTPMSLWIQGRTVKAVFSLNTMTHPAYTRQGIFTHLAELVYTKCQQEGFNLVYGFPNDNSYRGFTQKLGWTGLGKMMVWQKNLQDGFSTTKPTEVCEVNRFSTEVDLLWSQVKTNYKVAVPRTQGFLNWRFTAHPTIVYSKCIIPDSYSGMLGYIVLKTYTEENELKGHVVDMICVRDANVIRNFLNYSYRYFSAKKVQKLSCWIPDDSLYASVLQDEGFVASESPTNFGVLTFVEPRQIATRLDSWYLTMSDSDVF